MKTKQSIFVGALLVIALIWFLTGRQKEVIDAPHNHQNEANAQMENPHATDAAHTMDATQLPTVVSVNLAIKLEDEVIHDSFKVIPNETVKLPGTDYSILASDFYTHWNWKDGPINLSRNANNPAIKVEVFKGDVLQYHQWAFKQKEFFNSGGGAGHSSPSEKSMTFTLMGYEGLDFGDNNKNTEGN